jgi:ABC-type bacteriocin/lantibiotic exporter with double-glycine peptidase domain
MDVGDVKMRMDDDISCISDFSNTQTVNLLVSYGTLLVAAVLIFFIEWKLALIAVAVTPLTFVINHFISKKEWKMGEGNRENDQKTWTWLYQSVPGWREVRALNLQKREERQLIKFNHYFGNYFTAWNNYWVTRVLVLPRVKSDVIIKFALYFFGGLLIMSGDLTIGSLLVFAVYYEMMLNAVGTVSSADADLQSNRFKSDRLIEEITAADTDKKHEYIAPNSDSTIELQGISFTYDNTVKEIIHDFSLKINPGERVAITGKSGVGKTTLLKLMTGMISPTSGAVNFSGVNLSEIDPKKMHSRIGYVMQENTLFNTTIRENLLYAKQKATDEELIKACEKAYILDFINELPDGFDTVIGEKGIKLSGGQRQRIVLARLFLRDVDVFIFDEATSALDQYSENIIQDAIKNIAADKTIIVVAHRESSVRLCERKILL